MSVIRLGSFERALKKLSRDIRARAEEQVGLIESNQRDPRLHIKKLGEPLEGVFSFRITRNYRVLFYCDVKNNIILFDADNRKDVYR